MATAADNAPVIRYRDIASPIGSLRLFGHDDVLRGLSLADHVRSPAPDTNWLHDGTSFREAQAQLSEYFSGVRTNFEVEFCLAGTPFQMQVWSALADIPCGGTASYADIARSIDRPTATRAVGAAIGRNPLAIIVPCHRVIGADGSLTGYAWGTGAKAWLLSHERGLAQPNNGLAHATSTG